MRGVLYDAPSVIAGAQEVLAAHGVANRCDTVSGDFFQSAPAGGDAYILKHIIHDWSDEECLTILSHCHAGMNAGGKVLIVEMVIPSRMCRRSASFLIFRCYSFCLAGNAPRPSTARCLIVQDLN
jgi:hypothetical protein